MQNLSNMNSIFIEHMRCVYQIDAWETFGKNAVAVVSEGTPGNYDDNPTVKEYKEKGYKLVDANMFGKGFEFGEILIFIKNAE